MSVQIGLYLVLLLGLLWILLVFGLCLLFYAYGEQNDSIPAPPE